MKVERIDHIHIAVKDLKKVAKFLSEILGSKWVGPLAPAEGRLIVAFDNLGLELFQQPKDKGDVLLATISDFIDEKGEGLFCLGVKVPNLDEAVAELEARGIRMLLNVRANESLRVAWPDPRDTYGIRLELLEYEERIPIVYANLDVDKKMEFPTIT